LKTFPFVTYTKAKKARVFVPHQGFTIWSNIFGVGVGAYTTGDHLNGALLLEALVLLANNRLGW